MLTKGGDVIVAKRERMVPVTAYVPRRIKEELDEMASLDDRMTVSAMIDAAIRRYLQEEKKEGPAHDQQMTFAGV